MRAARKCLSSWVPDGVICPLIGLEARLAKARGSGPESAAARSAMTSCRPPVTSRSADLVRRQPFEIVVLVVQHRLAGRPACRERHDQVVPPPPAVGSTSRHPASPTDLDLEPGLLVDLAMQRRVQGSAEFDPAARQRIEALARRARAPHQQHLAVAEDHGADGELGTGGLIGGFKASCNRFVVNRSCPIDPRRSNVPP